MTGRALPATLAFGVGFIDTAVFIHMGGLFVAHVTGNFVLLGAALAGASVGGEHAGAATLQLIAFPVFFIAAMLTPAIAARIGAGRRTPALLMLAAGLFAVAGLAGAVAPGRGEAAFAMLLVVGMGVTNAAHRLDPKLGPPFTVMTGNVTAVAIAAARGLRLAPAAEAGDSGSGSTALLTLVIAFAAGCAAGAWLQSLAGLAAVLLPAALMPLALARRPAAERRTGTV